MSASPLLLARAAFEPLLDGLTPDQQTAVTHGRGPQVIFAGPGAGKTKTLIARIRYLLATGRAIPREILLVTFTNNAARECAQRLERELGREHVARMTICTFHSLCARIVRTHAHLVERTPAFTIYDERTLSSLIKEILADSEREEIQDALEGRPPPPADPIGDVISLAKNRLWTADVYGSQALDRDRALVSAVWRALDDELKAANAAGFDDLLALAVYLLGAHPELQQHYRERWRWLLVDEVQDTCYAQMGLLRLLAQPAGNLTICGDIDQALYSFRGAEPRNLLTFPTLFPTHRTVRLAVNFRSHEEIVLHAERLISHNQQREPLRFTSARGPGGHVRTKGFENEYAEAAWIAKEIAHQVNGGVRPEQILVLARSNYAYAPTRKALEHAGIGHHVLGSLGLFERREVKDALAYLQLIQNPLDSIALRRALSNPRREVGAVSCQAIVTHARSQQIDLLEACARHAQIPRLRTKARDNLERFASQMLAIRASHQQGAPVSDVVAGTLRIRGGLERHYGWLKHHADSTDEQENATAALLLLTGMREAAARYQQQEQEAASEPTLLGFVERAVGLHSDGPVLATEGVGISSIHGAKGKEAPVVFLIACEEGVTPSRQALANPTQLVMEEERSAVYVGMTRAESLLVATWSAERNHRPRGRSRFLEEAGL